MANEKVLGLVSGTRDGKLLVVTTPTRCDDPVADEVYMGLVSGTRNGKPLVAISTQRCGGTGLLETGRGYLGLVSGTRGGKLLLAVPCGDCDEPDTCSDLSSCGYCTGDKLWHRAMDVTVDVSCYSAPLTFTAFIPGSLVDPLYAPFNYGPCGLTADPDFYQPGDIFSQLEWFKGDGSGGIDEFSFTATKCDDSVSIAVSGPESDSYSFTLKLILYVTDRRVGDEESDFCVDSVWTLQFGRVTYKDGEEIKNIAFSAIHKIPEVPIADANPAIGECNAATDWCTPNATLDGCDPEFMMSASGNIVCADDPSPCEVCQGNTPYTSCEGASWSVEIIENTTA